MEKKQIRTNCGQKVCFTTTKKKHNKTNDTGLSFKPNIRKTERKK